MTCNALPASASTRSAAREGAELRVRESRRGQRPTDGFARALVLAYECEYVLSPAHRCLSRGGGVEQLRKASRQRKANNSVRVRCPRARCSLTRVRCVNELKRRHTAVQWSLRVEQVGPPQRFPDADRQDRLSHQLRYIVYDHTYVVSLYEISSQLL